MSSSAQPISSRENATRVALPMRTMWGRLLWKDAREILPIWVTLLFAAGMCVMITFWMVNHNTSSITPLYLSGHTFIALISVITGVFLFAGEDENRTLQLLRNLPLPPKQIVWQKILLGAAGVIALSCLLAIVTLFLAHRSRCVPLVNGSSFSFTISNVVLLPLLYLVIAFLSSMASRSQFYGVLLAGTVSAGVIAFLEPTWFGARADSVKGREIRWLWVAVTVVVGMAALVFNASSWVEERVIKSPRIGRKSNAISKSAIKVPPNPFSVLLWQSFKQSRVLLLCCIGVIIIGWGLIAAFLYAMGPSELALALTAAMPTLLWTLAAVAMFSSSIFLDDKRQGNYLFFQQNRERSRWFWLSRLLPFWGLALLLVLTWNFLWFDFGTDSYQQIFSSQDINSRAAAAMKVSMLQQAASQSVLVPLMALLGIICIGQYFSMFVRNPVLSFVFAGVVSVVFVALMLYVVFVNENVWLFVLPTIVAGYVATWWRSKSWLATSPYAKSFLLPIAVPVVVFTITAAMFTHHRATEFEDVSIQANNFASWNGGVLAHFSPDDAQNIALSHIEFGTEEQRQKAAALYQEAIELYQGDGSPMGGSNAMPWSAEETAEFVNTNRVAIDKIIQASQLPTCALFLSTDLKFRHGQKWALVKMALVNSHHELLESNLPAAKRSIDAYDRVLQRSDYVQSINRRDSGYYSFLISWADHPEQKLEDIQSAIEILEGYDTVTLPTRIVAGGNTVVDPNSNTGISIAKFYREFGGERIFMNLQDEVANLQEDNLCHHLVEIKHNYRLCPWEYQRYLKVAQLRTIQAFTVEQAILYESNPWSVGNQVLSRYRVENSIDWYAENLLQPHIPIVENRTSEVGNYHAIFGLLRSNVARDSLWRSYTLARLGLAAYKIEHGHYPDDLKQLESYYKVFSSIARGDSMFAWYKDGLGVDLIDVKYKDDIQFGELESAKRLAGEKQPLLLPFFLDPTKPLPEPVDYGKGQGVDIARLADGGWPNYKGFSYYTAPWSVGAEVTASD